MKYKHLILYPWYDEASGTYESRETGFYLAKEVNLALGLPENSNIREAERRINQLKETEWMYNDLKT